MTQASSLPSAEYQYVRLRAYGCRFVDGMAREYDDEFPDELYDVVSKNSVSYIYLKFTYMLFKHIRI